MKRTVLLATLALSCGGLAHAQQTFEPQVPRGLPEQRIEPVRDGARDGAPDTARGTPPTLVQKVPSTASDADARHCLAANTNKAIHRCAERYRHRSAAVRKTKK